MQYDTEEFSRRLGVIGACDAVVPLRRATMHALELFGCHSAYFLAPLTLDARVGRILSNFGLSWTWERHYRAHLHLLDPLPQISVSRLSAVLWPDDLKREKLSRKQKRYLEIAGQHGLARGVGVACFGPNGRSGFLGAVLGKGAQKPEESALLRIHSIGQVSFQTYCRIVVHNDAIPALSNRELEVLHWIGRGKSNSVIADILEISRSSVDIYIRRIFTKLDVTDRTTASIKAFAKGLLVSSDYERFVNETQAGRSPGDLLAD